MIESYTGKLKQASESEAYQKHLLAYPQLTYLRFKFSASLGTANYRLLIAVDEKFDILHAINVTPTRTLYVSTRFAGC